MSICFYLTHVPNGTQLNPNIIYYEHGLCRKEVISKLDELGVRGQIEDIITKAREDEDLSESDMFRHLEVREEDL